MAVVFPENFIGNHRSEKKVYKTLKETLPDQYYCYFNYNVGVQECDLYILVPDKGIVAVEIKSYSRETIREVRDNNTIILKNGRPPQTSPYKQARRFSFALRNEIKKHVDKNWVVASMVCYPNISKQDFIDLGLTVICRLEDAILAEDLENRERLEEKLFNIIEEQRRAAWITHAFEEEDFITVRSIIERRDWAQIKKSMDKVKMEETNESTNSVNNKREHYSILTYVSSLDEQHPYRNPDELVQLWCNGVKIIAFYRTNEEMEAAKQKVWDKIRERNLDHRFRLQDHEGNWESSVFQFYFYQIEYETDKPIVIIDGSKEAVQEFDSFLQEADHRTAFNYSQYKIEHAPIKQHIVVKAGAGTGKTFSMVQRINYLTYAEDLDAKSLSDAIFMITFTNEAADEMKKRIKKNFQDYYLLTNDYMYFEMIEAVDGMRISTIHSLAKRILQKFAPKLGLGKDLAIVSGKHERNQILEDEINSFLSNELGNQHSAIKQLGVDMYILKKRLNDLMDRLENHNIDYTDDALDWGEWDDRNWGNLISTVLKNTENRMRERLASENKVRISDLILNLKRLTNEFSDLEEYRGKVKYVFIDEFQDTDNVQIDLIKSFQNRIGFNFFVVGDIKQCIYRFRGAEERAFDRLIGDDPKKWGLEFSLQKNYRTDTKLLKIFEDRFARWGEEGLLVYNPDSDQLIGQRRFPENGQVFRKVEIGKSWEAERFNQEFIRVVKEEIDQLPPREQRSRNDKIAILVRDNYQIELVRGILQGSVYVETDSGGDLFQLEPVLDLYKLVLALLYHRSPEYLANLYTTPYADHTLSKIDLAFLINETGSEEEREARRIQYFSENPPIDKVQWKQYIANLRGEPALSVIWSIISNLKPWIRYGMKYGAENDQRAAARFYKRNLDLALEHLVSISKTDYLSLNKIEQYLRIMITTKQTAESRDSNLTEHSDVVCMTVHKSKGMEFHTVIMPFGDKDITGYKAEGITEVIHFSDDKLGISLRIDDGVTERRKTINNNYYNDEKSTEAESKKKEETRILYVAITRAIRKFVYFYKPTSSKCCWQRLIEMG